MSAFFKEQPPGLGFGAGNAEDEAADVAAQVRPRTAGVFTSFQGHRAARRPLVWATLCALRPSTWAPRGSS